MLSVEWIEKYQRQGGLLSRLASVIKGLGTVKKRTHFKITTVSEEVTYPLSVEQRTLTCAAGKVKLPEESDWTLFLKARKEMRQNL